MNTILELQKINNIKDLNNYIDELIKKNTNRSIVMNEYTSDYLGFDLDINPHYYDDNSEDINIDYYNYYKGYIPKGFKIIYGYELKNNKISNRGMYYYLDDDAYIYDFLYYIKDKDIQDNDDIIMYIFIYIRSLLENKINYKQRPIIHKLILKNDNDIYNKPSKEHSIKDFYYNGSAECSEYAVLAENLMTICGLDTSILMTNSHAFNIYKENDQYSILDFSNQVNVYDINFKFLYNLPFFYNLNENSLNDIMGYINGDNNVNISKYYIQSINDTLYEYDIGDTDLYNIDYVLVEDKELKLTK